LGNSTLKRIFLSILTLLVAIFVTQSLVDSFGRPQEISRLDLLQTDLILEAAELRPDASGSALKAFLLDGKSTEVYDRALQKHQEARSSNLRVNAELTTALKANSNAQNAERIQSRRRANQDNIQQIELRIGILQAQLGRRSEAIATWEQVANCQGNFDSVCVETTPTRWSITARILQGLWSEPVAILPDAETQIRQALDGWFRDRALERLYVPQQRDESLLELQNQTQVAAESALGRLTIVNSVTIIGGLVGIIVWLFLGVQRLFFPDKSPFGAKTAPQEWQVNWSGETTWEVTILWATSFIVISQVVLPIALQQLAIVPNSSWSFRDQAMLVLIPYVLSMAPMLPILSFSLKPFTPLPKPWFRFRILPLSWLRWGILGFIAAIPLVVIVSLIGQQLLQGQGGGSPLLPILVESQDSVAKFILWVTVAIAAPFFEELLFRGFLLPSLIKLTSIWPAIAISGFLFALAHLNLGDIMPLTVLGMVLGFVYMRSGNLLAPMLLHGLWNSGSFLALVSLGSK
jgi:uncharacterized protein